MHNTQRLSWAFLLCLIGAVTGYAFSDVRMSATVIPPDLANCIGKPYPSEGCPQKRASVPLNPLGRPPHCGDAFVQTSEGEECDLGRFNGISTCSDACTQLYCGDTIVTPFLGEECEPEFDEVYAIDAKTGQIGTERTFHTKTCGKFCQPPQCDASGYCSGGCTWTFLEACAASSSSASEQTSSVADAVTESFTSVSAQNPDSLRPAAPAVRCGDGIVEDGEECDDGTRNSDLLPNACRTNCRRASCGDATIDHGEQCDDGTRNGRPCSAAYNQTCTYCGSDCRSMAIQGSRCGDGIVDHGEQCDDGSRNGQVCTASYGETCSYCGDDCRAQVIQGPRCGDGIVEQGEQCDDGSHNGQICTAAYDQQCSYCSNTCTAVTVLGPHCGDAVVDRGEQCDDGPRNSDTITGACRSNCTLPHCGDGVLDKGEQCDDGSRNGQRCTVSDGQSCEYCSLDCAAVTLSGPRCGDGIVQGSEQCDDGPKNSDVLPNTCRTDCTLPRCGDGVLDKGELCDQGTVNSDVIPNACRLNCTVPRCGDAVIDQNEECDGGVDCTADCRKVGWFMAHAGIIGAGGIAMLFLSLVLGFSFRKAILAFLKSGLMEQTFIPSIDDIPLDELEMPWQRFGGKMKR